MANLQTPYCITGVAGADLRGHANKFVAYDVNKRLVPCVAATSGTAIGGPVGVCYSNVGSLQGCAYAVRGNTDVIAANTLAPGDFVTSNGSSTAVVAAAGNLAVGQVYEWARPGALARVEMCQPFRFAV